tara:strand:+ start:1919 stop:3490 length:1572 start_codon:yes stop_codon:yes gene_type:complete
MAFNGKRKCCCDSTPPVINKAFFEVKSVVPIAAAEQVIDKTYSYWFERPDTTFVDGEVPDSTVLWERGSSTNINSELTADLTYGAWKTAGSETAYVGPNGGNAYNGSSNTFVEAGSGFGLNGEALERALTRRGWYLTSTTRVLTEAQFDALDECKVLMPLPSAVSTGSSGDNAIQIYSTRGWMFGDDQYNATPAIGPITKGDLTWEVYPKVNCNYPVGGNVHDFTALFPANISFSVSGTMPIGTYRPFEGFSIFNVNGSGNYQFSKVTTGTGTGSISIKYEQTSPDPSNDSYLGQVEVTGDDLLGGTFTATCKLEQPVIGDFGFGVSSGDSNSMTLLGTSSNCTTQFGYFPDDNRLLCDDCDPNSFDMSTFSSCSPANFDGGFLKDKNYVYFPGSRLSALPDNNTLGADLSLEENYPTEEALFGGTSGILRMLKGLANGPLLAWGAATGSTVNIEVKAPNGIGLTSYLLSPPVGRCINSNQWDSGPLVGYFMNNFITPVYGLGSFDKDIDTGQNGVVRFTQTD